MSFATAALLGAGAIALSVMINGILYRWEDLYVPSDVLLRQIMLRSCLLAVYALPIMFAPLRDYWEWFLVGCLLAANWTALQLIVRSLSKHT